MTPAEFTILSLIVEKPSHGWELEKIIAKRGMREWTALGFSSIYYLLQKLEKKELVTSRMESLPGRGPARKIYQTTTAGKVACREQTLAALQSTHRSQAPILMGLANLPHVPLAEALAGMKKYRRDLQARLSKIKARRRDQRPLTFHVEALFDYSLTIIGAEKKWIDKMIEELEVRNDED